MLAGSFGASGEERRTTCWMRASGERTPNLAWVLGHHSPKDGGPRVGVGGPPPRSRPLGTKGGGPRNAGRRLRRLGPRRWDGGRRVAAPRDHRRRSSSPDAWVVHYLFYTIAFVATSRERHPRLQNDNTARGRERLPVPAVSPLLQAQPDHPGREVDAVRHGHGCETRDTGECRRRQGSGRRQSRRLNPEAIPAP